MWTLTLDLLLTLLEASLVYSRGRKLWRKLFSFWNWTTLTAAYLVQTASSSAARVSGTGRCSSSPLPGCSRVCRSSRSYRPDNPPTLRCSIQAGRSRWLTFCKHFLPLWTGGWMHFRWFSKNKCTLAEEGIELACVFMWYFKICITSSSEDVVRYMETAGYDPLISCYWTSAI